MMNKPKPKLISLYLFVSDVIASNKFYEALGIDMDAVSAQFTRGLWSGKLHLNLVRWSSPEAMTPVGILQKGCAKVQLILSSHRPRPLILNIWNSYRQAM